MNAKTAKGKPAKAKKRAKAKSTAADRSVLGSLPSTRPSRLGRHREEIAPASAAAAKTVAASGAAVAKTPSGDGAAKTPTAARPAPSKRPTARPRSAGRPEPVSSVSPGLERPGGVRHAEAVPPRPAPPAAERRSGPPSGTRLVATAVQAAGELAQIGFTVGGQILKRTVDRLPRP
jgi:hypothetical protein